jgi:hypothetical protein
LEIGGDVGAEFGVTWGEVGNLSDFVAVADFKDHKGLGIGVKILFIYRK